MRRISCVIFCLMACITFAQIPNEISKAEKVYGLSQFWQEVNYSYVYFDKVNQLQWNNRYKEYITAVQQTANDYAYYRLLQKFSAYLNDGHTNVWMPKYLRDHIFNGHFGEYRFELKNFEGRAFITRINTDKSSEIPLGTEILEVNGLSTAAYVAQEVLPFIASSTAYVRQELAIEYMLQGYEGTSYQLKLKLPSGVIKDMNLTIAKSTAADFYPPKEKRNLVDLTWQEQDIAHVAINTFYDWDTLVAFQEVLPEIRKAKGLIIDLRENGGGNSKVAKVVLHYLTNDTIFYGVKSQSRQYIPTLKAWNQDEYYYDFPYRPDTLGIGDRNLLKESRVVLPTAILIGSGTASAAEDFLVYADKQAHMTKIGGPTNGSTGQPLMIRLPNGGWGRVCTKKDTYPDGREFVGLGIQPDVAISNSLEDYLNNNDAVIQKALVYLRKKI